MQTPRPRRPLLLVGHAAAVLVVGCATDSTPAPTTSTVTETVVRTVYADDDGPGGADSAADGAGAERNDDAADRVVPPTITVPSDRPTGGEGAASFTTAATSTIATVDVDGIVTVRHPDAAPDAVVMDIYEDALCPYCRILEENSGPAIAAALEDGTVIVRYRMVDFLNSMSASGDYSTRALAALITLAEVDGDAPGVVAAFHGALFDAAVQPDEHGTSDLSDGQLAQVADAVGASSGAVAAIASGDGTLRAAGVAERNMDALREVAARVGRGAGTPTVAVDDVPVPTSTEDWLAQLLAG